MLSLKKIMKFLSFVISQFSQSRSMNVVTQEREKEEKVEEEEGEGILGG